MFLRSREIPMHLASHLPIICNVSFHYRGFHEYFQWKMKHSDRTFNLRTTCFYRELRNLLKIRPSRSEEFQMIKRGLLLNVDSMTTLPVNKKRLNYVYNCLKIKLLRGQMQTYSWITEKKFLGIRNSFADETREKINCNLATITSRSLPDQRRNTRSLLRHRRLPSIYDLMNCKGMEI